MPLFGFHRGSEIAEAGLRLPAVRVKKSDFPVSKKPLGQSRGKHVVAFCLWVFDLDKANTYARDLEGIISLVPVSKKSDNFPESGPTTAPGDEVVLGFMMSSNEIP